MAERPNAALVAAALLLTVLCAMMPSAQTTRLHLRHRTRETLTDFDDSDDGSGGLADGAAGEGEGDGLSVGAMDSPTMDGSAINPFASAVELRELGEERDQIAADPGQAPLDAVTELDTPDLQTGGEATDEQGFEDGTELQEQEQEQEQEAYQGDEPDSEGAEEARDALEGREDESEPIGDDESAAQEMAQDEVDAMASPEYENEEEQLQADSDQSDEQDDALIQLSEDPRVKLARYRVKHAERHRDSLARVITALKRKLKLAREKYAHAVDQVRFHEGQAIGLKAVRKHLARRENALEAAVDHSKRQLDKAQAKLSDKENNAQQAYRNLLESERRLVKAGRDALLAKRRLYQVRAAQQRKGKNKPKKDKKNNSQTQKPPADPTVVHLV